MIDEGNDRVAGLDNEVGKQTQAEQHDPDGVQDNSDQTAEPSLFVLQKIQDLEAGRNRKPADPVQACREIDAEAGACPQVHGCGGQGKGGGEKRERGDSLLDSAFARVVPEQDDAEDDLE